MLNCHTYFSLRYGTLSPQQLIEAAKAHDVKTLVLTDINNTSCSYEFVTRCTRGGIKPILGIEFNRDDRLLYIGIAKNNEGFRALNLFLTNHSLDGIALPDVPPRMENVYFIYTHFPKQIQEFRDNEYFGIRPDQVNQLFRSDLKKYLDKLVIFSPVTFLNQAGFNVHRLLRAIDQNVLLSKLLPEYCAKREEVFYKKKELETIFQQYPHVIKNTQKILDECSIEFKSGLHNNKRTFTGSKESDFKLLTKLALNGCKKRYGNRHPKAEERVRRELKVIERLDFCKYFLITWDIIRYAHTSGYHHVGRGSGANSIVAFCLWITDVDPLELDLYFERFINPYRTSPPDFDIDFSWDERDDVTDYIFKRYGREHVALLATYSTFKGKSIVRELGKVFGLPKEEIDHLIKKPEDVGKHHKYAHLIFKYGEKIKGFPNHLSIHSGGVIITEKPIHYFTALQMMPKGFPITHFDMYHAEDFGFHKFDVLSQRGLGHIKDAVDLVKKNQGRAVDIHEVDKIMNDEKVKNQLSSGHCIGCFYIESPAMRGLLTKLHCDNYKHLVAASSIIRPGVAQSGMMREYIKRFHAPHSFEYLHPVFEKNLSETFGVMVYQEDTMKIIHHFAGLDMDESDVLRRIMTGKKYQGDTFEKLRKKYLVNCKARGYSDELTQEVWRQIESFSGYSFCKAHSASYAVESFQSLFLKAYFPLEFMVAVINNFGGFYSTEYYFHEAKMCGATLHAPCINNSFYLTTICGLAIYAGFVHLKSFENKVARRIVYERNVDGEFKNLEDFINRVNITADQLELLIRIGAFRFTGMNKYELMWEKNAVFNPKNKFETTGFLFADTSEHYVLPKLAEGEFDQAFDEIELLGFPLCSPFDLLENAIPANTFFSKNLPHFSNKKIKIVGYYVCKKSVRTSNGKLMSFGTWVDSEGQYFDTVHFPPSLQQSPFRGKGIYLIYGKVVLDFDFPSVEVERMERLAWRGDERFG